MSPSDGTRASPIAVFSPTLQAGGSEHVLGMLVERLRARSHPVDRVVGHRLPGRAVEHDGHGAVVHGLGATRMLGAMRPLIRYLVANRPRCLLSSLTYTNILVIMSVLAARTGTPLIVREATTVSAFARVSHSSRNRLLPLLVRLFYRYADQVIAVSHGVRDDLVNNLGVPAHKVRVIYNPVDAEKLKKLARQEVTHPWFADANQPVVVSVARLDESKDFDSLVHAIAIVNKHRKVRFVVLGEGPERSRIEALAQRHGVESQLWLAGHEANPYRFLVRANLFLHPSRVEGLPNAVLEALALGCAIVSSDCHSGPREILRDGRCGRLVAVGDGEAMAAAILETLDGGACAHQESHMERFDTDRVVDDYLGAVTDAVRLKAARGSGHGVVA